MLGLGLAASKAYAIFRPREDWAKIYNSIPRAGIDTRPFNAQGETPELIQGYIDRVNNAFGVLKKQIEQYRPDALIVLGADRGEIFSEINFPTFYVFTGKEVPAVQGIPEISDPVRGSIKIPCNGDLAEYLLKALVKKGFEISFGQKFRSVGKSADSISHSMASLVPQLVPDLSIPIIPVFINSLFPPLPSATRCFNLGTAISETMNDVPGRYAILASGGLSYDPLGRWVDERFDRWIIERLVSGKVEELKKLFHFDSEDMRGPTGEVRNWITAAAACRRPAKIVDYIPARVARTGLCFAYWAVE